MGTLATSKNLTILGVLTVIGAVVNAATQIFNGQTPDWNATVTAIVGGVGMILAKGQQSTGGTVDASGKPVA